MVRTVGMEMDSAASSSTHDTAPLRGRRRTDCIPSSIATVSGCLNIILTLLLCAMLYFRNSLAPDSCAANLPGVASLGVDYTRMLCSGNGMHFEDSLTCACFDCWTGDTCDERLEGAECVVEAGSGTPYIFEDYWVAHPEARISILPSYHIGYGMEVPRLEAAIRALHSLVGNAVTDGRHIVVGIGSTELIPAAMYALAPNRAAAEYASGAAEPAAIWSKSPFYSGYTEPAKAFDTRRFAWLRNATTPVPTAARPVVELVTSPNNPDGHVRGRSVPAGPHASCVFDHAYLWPHFTGVGPPVAYGNDTVALFTLSKMTGHASTRIGWALTTDATVAARMEEWMAMVTLGTPRENQLRAVAALEHVVAHRGEIFRYARTLMAGRWRTLEAIFPAPAGAGGFRLEPRDAPAAHDAFTGEDDYEPSPAYAWIELRDLARFNGSALGAMRSVGIKGRGGAAYGASDAFVRLELLMREATFEILAAKLRTLVTGAGA